MIKLLKDFDWNKNDSIPEEYKDNANVEQLKRNKLPIIKDLCTLFKALNLEYSDLKWLFFSNGRKDFLYYKMNISKKNGGKRELQIPNDKLMTIQKAINRALLNKIRLSENCVGFVKNKSIVTNAEKHIGAKVLLKFDIKDFFPSIKFYKVYKQFRFIGYGEKVAKCLTMICVDSSGSLPQGAPTSPALSNIVCFKLDKRIANFCSNQNLIYTRYADDITISSLTVLEKKEINFIKKIIIKIINEEGFESNPEKLNVIYSNSRMEVTGIVVNKKLSVKKEVIREVENAIRYIKKYGLENHLDHIQCDKTNYVGHIYGLVSYIHMIDKEKGQKLLIELDELKLQEESYYG